MESSGIPSKIHVSESARSQAIKTNPSFLFTERGNIEMKGKGMMRTNFLERNDRKSVWEICDRPRQAHQSIDGYQELHSDICPDQLSDLDEKTVDRKELTIIQDETNPLDGTEHDSLSNRGFEENNRENNNNNFQQNGTLPQKTKKKLSKKEKAENQIKDGNKQQKTKSKLCLLL
uniref:Guanylate cyclase domain-containing protein n=1 Tax=Meloidogyne enterolobii TaxID=390850 RepID=A0A6V7VAK8_MELEN|nr:unnamed protein product [Meloidogyne enterolobii]